MLRGMSMATSANGSTDFPQPLSSGTSPLAASHDVQPGLVDSQLPEDPLASGSGGDEESVEQYMADLIARYSMGASLIESEKPSPTDAVEPVTAEAPETDETMPLAEPAPEPVYVPSAERDLKPINLSAMRDLANVVARDAIGTYSRSQTIHNAYATLGSLGLALVAVTMLANTTQTIFSLNFLIILGALALACFWAGRYNRLTIRLVEYDGKASQAQGSRDKSTR